MVGLERSRGDGIRVGERWCGGYEEGLEREWGVGSWRKGVKWENRVINRVILDFLKKFNISLINIIMILVI